MNLFSKDKELINKIVNGMLLIWLTGALVFTFSIIVTTVIKDPALKSYKNYKAINCRYLLYDETTKSDTYSCKEDYQASKISEKYNKRIAITISLVNVIIVSSVLYVVNIKIKK